MDEDHLGRDWQEFLKKFWDSNRAAKELMLDLRDANPAELRHWGPEIKARINDLLIVQTLADSMIRHGVGINDAVHRAAATTALNEASLSLLRLKFVDFSRITGEVADELNAVRSALAQAKLHVKFLKKHWVTRRINAVIRRLTTGRPSSGFKDLEIGCREIKSAADSILLSIAIVLETRSHDHKSMAALLGTQIGDVIEHVQFEKPKEFRLDDLARLGYAIANTRVILLAYGELPACARCRAYLHALDGQVSYCASRLVNARPHKKFGDFAKRALWSKRESRRAEAMACLLLILFPVRKVVGTLADRSIPMAPWVTAIPSLLKRWKMRRSLGLKLKRPQNA